MIKQTAVEWLQWALVNTILTHEQVMQTIGLFEQAKDMEKEQIIEVYYYDPNCDEIKDDGETFDK